MGTDTDTFTTKTYDLGGYVRMPYSDEPTFVDEVGVEVSGSGRIALTILLGLDTEAMTDDEAPTEGFASLTLPVAAWDALVAAVAAARA